jgi:hypothetical protein
MVFSGVELLSHGLANMSGKYGVRIRCARGGLGVYVNKRNYGAIIFIIRVKG